MICDLHVFCKSTFFSLRDSFVRALLTLVTYFCPKHKVINTRIVVRHEKLRKYFYCEIA